MSETQQSTTKTKTVASVSFDGTRDGKLDESDIPSDDFESHYLYPGETKSESSYPVVDGENYLRRGNVESAYSVGARGGVDEDDLHSKLQKLNGEFDNPPIDFDDDGDEDENERTESAVPDGAQYREKSAEFRAADPQRQVVYGAVLLANELDHHGDFFRDSTVESLADGFMEAVSDPDAEPAGEVDYPETAGVGGVMHAVFPQEHLTLAENTILDEERSVGTGPAARAFPAGTWIQGWKVSDDNLWELIAERNALSGFSIGMWVEGGAEYDPGELPDDVAVPDAVEAELAEYDLEVDDVYTGEITDGTVHEVSMVDHPAVPRALHVAHKSLEMEGWKTNPDSDARTSARDVEPSHALAKAAGELTESYDSCVEYLVDNRGHSADDAEALATYLQRVVDGDGLNAGTPEKATSGLFGRAKSWVGLSNDVVADKSDADTDDTRTNLGGVTIEQSSSAEKAGRTLSSRNRRRMMVLHDLTLSVLRDANVDGGRMPFTDDPEYDLDVDLGAMLDGAAGERSGPGGDDETEADTGEHSQQPIGAAARADSPRDVDSDSDIPMQEDELTERFDTIESSISELSETVSDLADDADAPDGDDPEGSAELSHEELAKQVAERAVDQLREERREAAADDEEQVDEELDAKVEQLAQNQKELNDTLSDVVELTSAIADADGVSQQTVDRTVADSDTESSSQRSKAEFFGI